MNDNEYIRKAVELAYGWERRGDDVWMPLSGWPEGFLLPELPGQIERDALAAQLVRQVYTHQVRPQQFVTYVNYALDPIDTIRDIVASKMLEAT